METSRPWSGEVLGDAGGYTDDDWTDIWRRLLGAVADADTGILSNVGNELVVTGAATPLSVATGVALNGGTFYENTAVETVPLLTPAAFVRVDRIVLRKDWALQTVRIYRLAGIEGAGPTALVQDDGTTWDMPLFQASIDLGGVIALTDERERLNTRIPSMTTAERDAMTPINGMLIYNETVGQHQGYEGGAWTSRVPSNFQRITASGNWAKPVGATQVFVVCIGAGGGGGGGEGQVAGSDRVGGGGGGGGAYAWKMFDAASLGAVEAVTIGAAGASGAGGTGADGSDGGNGGNTDFGTILYAYGGGGGLRGGDAHADGGGGGGTGSAANLQTPGSPFYNVAPTGDANGGSGAVGRNAGVTADSGWNAEFGGASGGAGALQPVNGATGGSSLYGGGAGASGGGLPVANTENIGGVGGVGGSYTPGGGGASGAADGGAGGAGPAGVDEMAGGGGGGGGSNDDAVGGAGGAGGAPGGGGGGGGGGTNVGGAGGVGERGEVWVFSW